MFAGCRCPRCPDDRTLNATKIEGRDVLSCRRCGGVLVGIELGLRLLAVLRADVLPQQTDAPQAACPVCRAAMRTSLANGIQVRVEICRRHGVWFDDEDLLLVARAVAAALGKPVPQAVASLDDARSARATVDAEPSPAEVRATGHAPPPAAWTPVPTSAGERSRAPVLPVEEGVLEHAGHTALDVVDLGVGAVGTAVDIVALPVELSLAIVEGIGSLFD